MDYIKENTAIVICGIGLILTFIPFVNAFLEPEMTQTQLLIEHWKEYLTGLFLIAVGIFIAEK